MNLGNATGHPSFVMSRLASPTRRWRRSSSWTKPGQYEKQVYTLPKHLDEKVAALHLAKIGAKLTKLTPEQSNYIGVPQAGPFKPEPLPVLAEESPDHQGGELLSYERDGIGAPADESKAGLGHLHKDEHPRP